MTDTTMNSFEELQNDALDKLKAVASTEALRELEIDVLGRKGRLKALMKQINEVPPEDRAEFGRTANAVKVALEQAFAERAEQLKVLELQQSFEQGAIDVTLPGRPAMAGRIHPATQTLREIYDIWAEMGFQVYRTRDVEDDDMNFTLLNIPPHHPSRDMWDTFYTKEEGIILRTHTSPGQIRVMREYAPKPVRAILPGMCYRYEQVDASHEIQFNQVEGIAVGKKIRMSDLKGTMIAFAQRMFGADRKVRFRCSHFPFTEPSVEVDIEWEDGWLEIGGAGMVHPIVLKNGGYDPSKFSGFAFGIGPERITLLKHSIQDIRYFWGNDLRFLEQF